jgi:hypothetical protein
VSDNAVNSADADTVLADSNNDHPAISDDEVPGPANGNALNNSTTEGGAGATLIDSDVDGPANDRASSQAADSRPAHSDKDSANNNPLSSGTSRAHGGNTGGDARTSRFAEADLTFSVRKFHRKLKKGRYAKFISEPASGE